MKYYKAKEVKKIFGITNMTLYNWKNNGTIGHIKINRNHYLYDISDLLKKIEANNGEDEPVFKTAIYARVSNTKQKNDLIKQEKLLREYAVVNGNKIDYVFTDIASGMNENRKDFNKMLKLVFDGSINKIIISYKDRLTRFGFNYFEYIFSLFDVEIEVVNLTKEEDFQTELTEDLISIIHHFSMKMYSNRRKKLKQIQKDILNFDND